MQVVKKNVNVKKFLQKNVNDHELDSIIEFEELQLELDEIDQNIPQIEDKKNLQG